MRPTALAFLGLAACVHAGRPASAPISFRVEVSGHGPPVILIPDLAAPASVWNTTVAHLKGRAQTHALTLPGFAGQPAIEGPLLPRVTRELVGYLRERHLEGAILVGHMFGAAVAYSVAAAAPDLIGGVVAIDVLPCQAALGEPEESRAQAIAEAEQAHAALVAHPLTAERLERRLRTMVSDPAIAHRLAEQGSRSSGAAVADAFLELMQLDLRGKLRASRVPVLAVVTDLTYPPEAWPGILAGWHRQIDPIPHHGLVEVHGAHHYVMFDRPDAWFAALDAFLAR